jgi:hypothetical protein
MQRPQELLGAASQFLPITKMSDAEIEAYLTRLRDDELAFKEQQGKLATPLEHRAGHTLGGFCSRTVFFFRSILDCLILVFVLRWYGVIGTEKRLIYTTRNFCTERDGRLHDRIVTFLPTSTLIFINSSKQYALSSINGKRVFNVGGLVKLLSRLFYRKNSEIMSTFKAHRLVNDLILSGCQGKEVYTLCYYDLNGLSLAFSSHRQHIQLIEVQHGSIINYPPYVEPSPVKIADVFYVKNEATIRYLQSHLCRNYPSEYRVFPYPKKARHVVPGLHILYASSIEFNGLHPVFAKFISAYHGQDLTLTLRLHPRERDKEDVFTSQLSNCAMPFKFDRSQNWLEANEVENLIVISPWSSTLEDAYDNGFVAITIDPVGRKRFHHLIDGSRFLYSDDLAATLEGLCHS